MDTADGLAEQLGTCGSAMFDEPVGSVMQGQTVLTAPPER
jgi:hypothetical protein